MDKFLFYNKFISCLYMFRAPCAHHQEVKLLLYSICYHHPETNEWSKINKIKFYKYEQIPVFIELYFSNFRPLTCFSVMIPEDV